MSGSPALIEGAFRQAVKARLLPLGDAAWTVEFGRGIDPELNARVMSLAEQVRTRREVEALFAGVLDVVPTFRSLTVHFDPLRTEADRLGERLLALAAVSGGRVATGRRWRLPVCFEAGFAPDLAGLAAACGLGEDAVVRLLTTTRFRVYMIGFMPGFPYMGGLPSVLAMPRLATPRQRVPAQSLAVAGSMCCVYPWESPGGWRLLGRMPLPLFELQQGLAPAWLAAGDEVGWQAIDRATCERLAADWAEGALTREAFLVGEGGPCPVA